RNIGSGGLYCSLRHGQLPGIAFNVGLTSAQVKRGDCRPTGKKFTPVFSLVALFSSSVIQTTPRLNLWTRSRLAAYHYGLDEPPSGETACRFRATSPRTCRDPSGSIDRDLRPIPMPLLPRPAPAQVRFLGEADMTRRARLVGSVENDPKPT